MSNLYIRMGNDASHHCRVENAPDGAGASTSGEGDGAGKSDAPLPPSPCAQQLATSPLAEILFAALPRDMQVSQQTADLLLLLKLLEALNRCELCLSAQERP